MTQDTATLFVVNDRPDVAVLARADGVHVGQEELSVKDARTVVGPEMLIGVSTHSIEQARQAVLDGANYIGVGPTFLSGTKQFAFPRRRVVEGRRCRNPPAGVCHRGNHKRKRQTSALRRLHAHCSEQDRD